MTRTIINIRRNARSRMIKKTIVLSALLAILGGMLLGKECVAQVAKSVGAISTQAR